MNLQMIIDGKKTKASDGAVQNNINPSTGELIGTIPAATKEDVDRAVSSAKKGQKIWQAVPLYKKIEIFDRYRELIMEHKEELAKLMALEGGKLYNDALGEIDIMVYIFRVYGEGARNMYGISLAEGIEPRVEKDVIFTRHEPLGVVACIVPYNYPAELYAHKVAPALITGNSVIIKPASDTPMSAIRFSELLIEAGVTPQAVQILTGSGARIGDWLTSHLDVDVISLTGSTSVGAHIMGVAALHVPQVFLELGGNDPIIIMADCDLDQALKETMAGRISNAGQTCCGTKRVLVQNTIIKAFTEKLVEAVKHVKVGNPLEADTGMGPVINEKAALKVISDIESTVNAGAKCVVGGKSSGAFVEPTVLVNVTPNMDIAGLQEVFGPVFPVIGFDTLEEAIAISNQSPYGLQAGIMTQDMKMAMKAATQLKCGTVVINGSGNYRCAHQAFGGCKQTGGGREGVSYTLSEMTRTKTIAYKNILD